MSERSKFRVVPLTDALKPAVTELFDLCFAPRKLDIAYYDWLLLHQRAKKVFVDLFVNEREEVISHYAVSPALSFYCGREFLSAISVMTMTHPAYAGRGLFPKLAEQLYERLEADDVKLVYGFPNKKSHYSFATKLRWNDVFILPMLKKEICSNERVGPVPQVLEVFKADEFDFLWRRVNAGTDRFFPNARDSLFLRWRFLDCPTKHYSILTWKEGGRLSAYVVVKAYRNNHVMQLDMVDILSDRSIDSSAILTGALRYAIENDYKCVNTWLPVGSELYSAAEKLGFEPTLPLTYLGYAPVNTKLKLSELKASSSWYVTMADSDVY